MTISQKKKKILEYITKIYDRLDTTGYNTTQVKKLIEPMTDDEFTKFMDMVKSGQFQFRLIMPNMKSQMNMDMALELAKDMGVKIFHRIRSVDPTTGIEFLTPEEYPVLLLPIRRAQQTIEKKRSVARSDRFIDALTGQKTGDDKAAALSHPEIQVLYNRGLTKTLEELVQVRGGNIQNYGQFRTQLEDGGMVHLSELDPDSRTRASVMTNVLFASMHIDSNV